MTQNSYDFNNGIRDVSPAFDTLIAERPSFLRLISGGLGTSLNSLGSPMVSANKYEWVNESLEQFSSAITSFDTDGDGTGINVASTSGMQAGSIIRFESALGASRTELVQIASVDSATDLTVTRDYGASTGVTLLVGDVAFLVSTPRNEDSDVGAAILHQATLDYNFTEIFDEVANLSGTAMVTNTYDRASSMPKQVMAAMVRLSRKIEAAALYGRRVLRAAGVPGTMGGLLQYISAAGGNIETTGGAISQTLINNTIEDIAADGGMLSRPVILCAPNQSRRLSALNTSGTNPVVQKANTDRSLGNYVTNFVGDLPIDGGAVNAQIFSCLNMAKDQIAIVDADKVALRVMRGLHSKDATSNGTDGYKERILTEVTLEVDNGTKAHGLITGLDL